MELTTPMSQRVGSPGMPGQGRHGLSWAALLNRWILVGLVVVLIFTASWFDWWSQIGKIPIYWLVGVVGAIMWAPYFNRVHAAKQTQLVVYESPNRLTIYRVGRKSNGFKIDGNPVNLSSKTGFKRVFVTEYDPATNLAVGSQVKGYTTLDFLANVSTFDRLARKFTEHIEEDRLSRELVAVRQAEGVRENALKWVRIGVASQEPEPIIRELEALDIMRETDQDSTSLDAEEILDDL